MTNYEHMTDEEKRLAIINGIHIKKNGNVCACPVTSVCWKCRELGYDDDCDYPINDTDKKLIHLSAEYIPPSTDNEKLCETLKVGEVIAVSDRDEYVKSEWLSLYRLFVGYNSEHDTILTNGAAEWRYGRKLTAKEKGE